MPPLKKCRSALHLKAFGCVEHLRLLLQAAGMSLELLQLAGGPLRGDLLPLPLGPVRLLRIRLDGPLHVRGAKNPAHQLVSLDLTPASEAAPSRSHGLVLPSRAVCGLAVQGEVHLSVPAGAEVALMVIDRGAFERWCLDLGCDGLDEATLSRNWVRLDPQRHDDLRRCLRRLFALAGHPAVQPSAPFLSQQQNLVLADLMPLLLEALMHAAERTDTLLRPPARIELVMQVQRWISCHPDQPITLADLCRLVYVSRRSLIQGFRDHLGMGPMQYLKLQRLHSVRRALLMADPGLHNVTSLAAGHGFLNGGHFARDYQRLFGELPSATLRQAQPRGLSARV